MCSAADFEGMEALDTSPIQCYAYTRDTKNLRWTSEMDGSLCKILVAQVKLGNINKYDNKLRHAAYRAAVLALNERFQDLTKDHVRNGLKTLRKQYGILKDLLDHSESEWN